MELFAKIKVENIFKAKDFIDGKSGEVTPGKWKIQSFDEIQSEEGTQMKLIDISIPDELVERYKDKVGQVVQIPVGTFINNKKVGFYGLSS